MRRAPKGYVRSDERIFEDICESLMRDHDLDTSMLRVTVQGGVVTLEGRVTSRHDKYLVEQVAEAARGVAGVDNRLRVTRGVDGPGLDPALAGGLFGRLAREHRETSMMFEQVVPGRGDTSRARLDEFAALARDLLAHARAEQEVVYAALEREMGPEVRRAREEHALVERLVDDITALPSADDTWQAKVEVLRELVERHVREEEASFFPRALGALGPERADELERLYADAREHHRVRREEPAGARGRKAERAAETQGTHTGAEPAAARSPSRTEGGRSARR